VLHRKLLQPSGFRYGRKASGQQRRCSLLGEFFSETSDSSVAILHSYGAARVLFTGHPEEGVRGERLVHEALSDHQRSETTYTLSQGSAPC
jgi:hypothetical protein